MATNNAVNVGLAGATGTGNFVGANTPTLITPVLGAATATSVAFSPTTGGIIGTTTNDNAGAGKVGEFVSSNIAYASAVSMGTTGTVTNVTSISLTAGDWDVWGNIVYTITAQAGSTAYYGWVSSASATQPDLSLTAFAFNGTNVTGALGFAVPQLRFSLSGTTTIYLSGEWSGTVTTVTGSGGIYARRVR